MHSILERKIFHGRSIGVILINKHQSSITHIGIESRNFHLNKNNCRKNLDRFTEMSFSLKTKPYQIIVLFE